MKRFVMVFGTLLFLGLGFSPMQGSQNQSSSQTFQNQIPYSTVLTICKAACTPLSDCLGRTIYPETLVRAYNSGEAVILFLGKTPDGKHQFRIEYGGSGAYVILDDVI